MTGGAQARLRCGTTLRFAAPGFVPRAGEPMPCARHGYCVVAESTSGSGGPGRRPRRRRPRDLAELAAWLENRPTTTLGQLRRERFTLRVVWAGQRSGLLDLDPVSGVVARARLHSGGAGA